MGNIKNYLGIAGGCLLALASCAGNKTASRTVSGLDPAAFDTTLNGKKVELITLKNSNGMEVCLTNYGGRVVSLCVPDKNGKATDVVLGYDNIRQYADTLNSPSDFGSSVGRYANRIKNAQITVGGKVYKLRANDNENTLHGGGNTGWLHQVYDIQAKTDSSVTFAITAPEAMDVRITGITMDIAAHSTSVMCYHINTGFGDGFTDVQTIDEKVNMPNLSITHLALTPTLTIPAGETLHIRILPWYDSNGQPQKGKRLEVGELRVKGKRLL